MIARQTALREELGTIHAASERVGLLEKELEEASATYLDAAKTLSQGRRAAAKKTLASRLERLLAELAMKRTQFEVRFSQAARPGGEWAECGIDEAEFYLSPNPGEDQRPLAKIASGGELSRMMLALKTLASTDAAGKTLVFDEVDAGIGGRVADTAGRRLNGLGDKF